MAKKSTVTYTQGGKTYQTDSSRNVPVGATVTNFGDAKKNKSFDVKPSNGSSTISQNPGNLTANEINQGYSTIEGPYDARTGKLKNQSTTTLSSDKSKDIYGNNMTLDNYTQKGVQTDPETGVSTTASGSVYEPVEADTEDEDRMINKYYDQLTKSLDATTQSQIANAKVQFDQLRAEQRDVNTRMEKQSQNALLMGGATGQGSSAQFAPISSVGIVQSQVSYGLKQIAALDAQENNIIAEAKQAQQEGNFRIMEKKIAMVEEKRKEKIDAASKLNEQIAKANEKALEESKIVARETAITDAYANGLTDTLSIKNYLKELGVDAPVKEIKDTVDLLSGVGGTGMVGEYNFYASQERQAGRVPMSFNEYQDKDANRKKSIAKAGVASSTTGTSGTTYTSNQEKVIVRVEKDIANNAVYKRTVSMQGFADNVDASLSQGSGVGDIAAINQFQKVIDEGAVTRDQDVKLIQGAQSLSNQLQTKIKKLQKGEQLSPELRSQMKKAVADILEAQRKAIGNDPFIKAKKNELSRNGINADDTIFSDLEGYSGGQEDDAVVTTQKAANSVNSFIMSNPEADEVDAISKFYDKGMSETMIYEWLKTRRLVQ